jgi:hypothetical protein
MIALRGTHAKAGISALVGGLVTFLSSLGTALQGEHTGFNTITAGQWVTAVLAGLAGSGLTGAATSRTPNRSVDLPEPAVEPSAQLNG